MVLTRAGRANSGPAFKRRNKIHKSNCKRNSNIFYVLICGVLLTKVKTVRNRDEIDAEIKTSQQTFFSCLCEEVDDGSDDTFL